MLDSLIHTFKIGVVATFVGAASLLGIDAVQAPQLGATYTTPEVRALFTTSLASKITSSATSMTLVSATDKDGTALASSTYGFIIDEGTSVEEFVLADCTGTACTNMTRGLSVSTGTSTVASLRFEHRRGASVKMTDAPSLLYAMNVFKGKQHIENKLQYATAQTFTNATDIISKDYADALAFGGIPEATESAAGFGEIATGVEAASSTSSGSEARLILPASLATSTYNAATAGLKVVVTQNNGKIDDNFIGTAASPTGSITAYASTTAPSGWLMADGAAVSRTTYAALYSILGTSYGAGDGSNTFNLPNLKGRSIIGAGTAATKVATFVSRASNVITVSGISDAANNEFQTGQAVLYSAPSGAMTGLTHNTTYYLVRTGNLTFSLASSLANAQNGTVISLSSNGTGTQTFTLTLTARTLGATGGEENHAMSLTELLAHTHTQRMNAVASDSGLDATGQTSESGSETGSKGGNAAMNNMQPFVVLNYIIKY